MKQQKLECQLQKWGLNHQERSRRGQNAVTWVFKLKKKHISEWKDSQPSLQHIMKDVPKNCNIVRIQLQPKVSLLKQTKTQ